MLHEICVTFLKSQMIELFTKDDEWLVIHISVFLLI